MMYLLYLFTAILGLACLITILSLLIYRIWTNKKHIYSWFIIIAVLFLCLSIHQCLHAFNII
ncbi:hypothetical protein EDC32_102628 [Laceyella sacchari]|nr:hypothetical protein EDC32_102628 [Laceyella sacchari]